MNKVKDMWKELDKDLLSELVKEVKSKPTLARPDYNRRFYVKTDWSKSGSGMVIVQADPKDHKAFKAKQEEINGGTCIFDKTTTKTQLRLGPVAFHSWRSKSRERSWHSAKGEAHAGCTGFSKAKHFLLGRQFTWLTNCSSTGMSFLEATNDPCHEHLRWHVSVL